MLLPSLESLSPVSSRPLACFASLAIQEGFRTYSRMPCRSKKLISDKRSAAERLLARMQSKDICHIVRIAFDTPPSRRRSPASCSKSLLILRSLSQNSARYFSGELRSALAYMYAAAWLTASRTRSSAYTRSAATSVSGSDPSFFSRSVRASVYIIVPTSIMFWWRPVSLKAKSLLRVMMIIDPFRLSGRYVANGRPLPTSPLVRASPLIAR